MEREPTVSVKDVFGGRKPIYTSYVSQSMVEKNGFDNNNIITRSNIVDILNQAFLVHKKNYDEIVKLKNYYLNHHPILDRVKTVRPDVDNKVVLNFAQSVTRTIVGYTYGTPTVYKQRDSEHEEEINTLNEYNETLDKYTKDYERGEMASICGTSYLYTGFNNGLNDEDDVPYLLRNLDPESTFVIYSSIDHKVPVVGVTFYFEKKDQSDNILDGVGEQSVYMIAYTRDRYYKIKSNSFNMSMPALTENDIYSEDVNILGQIPIVEYKNNQWRLGDWESAISIFNALDTINSDGVNDIQQFVSSILVLINAELPKIEEKDPTTGELVETTDTSAVQGGIISLLSATQGGNVDAKYISKQLDAGGLNLLINILEQSYKVIVGVPDRKTNSDSGGDTGEAVSKRDGWDDLDIVATGKDKQFNESERHTLRNILKILQLNNKALDIKTKDVVIFCNRNKTANLVNKANAIATLVNTQKFDIRDIISLAQITTDENAMAKRGEEYQKQVFAETLKNEEEMQKIMPKPSINEQKGADNNKNIEKNK